MGYKLKGTEFQIKVWNEIAKIPKGKTKSYKEIAKAIGRPKSYRAVANACGKNPFPIEIPCHRVIKSNGELGGYSAKGGLKAKRILLSRTLIHYFNEKFPHRFCLFMYLYDTYSNWISYLDRLDNFFNRLHSIITFH